MLKDVEEIASLEAFYFKPLLDRPPANLYWCWQNKLYSLKKVESINLSRCFKCEKMTFSTAPMEIIGFKHVVSKSISIDTFDNLN